MSRASILEGKTVLITGASRGLGRAIAEEYGRHGCRLLLIGRHEAALASTLALVHEVNPQTEVKVEYCDLSDISQVVSMCRRIKDTGLAVDIVVNCAGVFPLNRLEDVSWEEYNSCMTINVAAPFVLTRELVPQMVENEWGRIINIASSSAYGGGPMTSVYSASKHALLGLSRSLFKELKGHGIRVLCVSPGSIKTDMGRDVERLGQDFETFMSPSAVAEYVVYNSALNDQLVSEEIRLNRMFIQ